MPRRNGCERRYKFRSQLLAGAFNDEFDTSRAHFSPHPHHPVFVLFVVIALCRRLVVSYSCKAVGSGVGHVPAQPRCKYPTVVNVVISLLAGWCSALP